MSLFKMVLSLNIKLSIVETINHAFKAAKSHIQYNHYQLEYNLHKLVKYSVRPD